MKTRLIPILTVAAATGSAFTAFADLEQRDSSQFTHKYEMVALPTAENVDGIGANDFAGIAANATWCTLGTGQDLGTISMAISGAQNIVSDKDSGTAGDAWHNLSATTAKEGGTGYTIEVRMKVTESSGTIGAISLNASTGDSDVDAWLDFTTDTVYWGYNKGAVIANLDVSAWHDYRIVREHGKTVHSVYIDGVLAGDNYGDGFTLAKINRILLGGANGNYNGKAQIAWLRFTKGAYAPVDEKAYVKANRMRSDEFDVKYEMDDGDNRISSSANASDWAINGASGATISKSDGVLSVNPNGNNTYWTTTDGAWKNTVTAGTPYTIEFSAKINSCALTGGNDRSLLFWAGSANAVGVLMVGVNHVYWQTTSAMSDNILLDTSDNTDKMHRFRIAYDGSSRHGFTVWRDDVMIGHILIDTTAYYKTDGSFNFVRFGKPGGNNSGSYDINYIRWKIGGVYPPDTRKGMTVVIR